MADWNFNVNLAGVAPAGAGLRNLPTGYYKGKIMDADGTVASTGRPQVAFKIEITDPEFAGISRTTWLGIPQTADDNVRYYWRAAFEAAGYTPAQIDAGAINASPGLFIGREVTIHYTAGDKDAGTRDNLRFLSPAAWDQGKKSESAVAVQGNGSALGGTGAKVTMPTTQALGGGMGAPAGGGLGGLGGMGGGIGGAALNGAGGAKPAATDLLKALGA